MIRLLKAYARQHLHVLRTTMAQLVRAPVASAMTIGVIGITLALPTGLFLVIDNLERVGQGMDAGGQISLFLKRDTAEQTAEKLASRIKHLDSVKRVEYISRDRALAEFKQLSGFSDALKMLDRNPLPPVLTVHPAENTTPASIEGLVKKLRTFDAVDSVQLDLDWVRRLHAMLSIAERAGIVLAGLLGLAVLLTIGNTIRLAIMNRRDEIEVMKLMGGTDAFVRRPFLYSGLIHGFLGAVTTWLVIALVLLFLQGPVGELAALYGNDLRVEGLTLQGSLVLLGVGALLGWLGSRLAVSRHLRAIEPS